MIKKAYSNLFNREPNYHCSLIYSNRLSPFNATITQRLKILEIKLSTSWQDIDEQIIIGCIQHLLCKLFRSKRHTQSINLYTNFIKNIPSITPKTKNDPTLNTSFNRINTILSIEKPNLCWGKPNRYKIASYNFHTDTITVSSLLKTSPQDILDYVMYHEALHKYHKFTLKNGRNRYHTKKFRQDEAQFPNAATIELKLKEFLRKI